MSQFVSGTADTDPEPVKPPNPLGHSLQFCAWRLTIMSITIGNAQSWPQSILLNSFIIHIIVSSYTLKGFIAQMLHHAWWPAIQEISRSLYNFKNSYLSQSRNLSFQKRCKCTYTTWTLITYKNTPPSVHTFLWDLAHIFFLNFTINMKYI